MREKSNSIRIKRKTIVYFVAALIALASVTPVLADYLGPNRTVTETVTDCKVVLNKCQFVAAKNTWKYKTANSWSCSNESKPWQAYPGNARSCTNNNHTNGYEYWERVDVEKEVTNTYPPATVSSELQNCTLNNGWCTTAPQLVVSGDEPVLGYYIIALEGSLNGQNFACSDSSCIVPLNEGANSIDYWALSSWGDSSTKDSFTAKVDSQSPNITGTLSGTLGSNGWYLSPISINGAASDVISGLASFTCTLDGAAPGSCSSIAINSDGAHTLILTAQDNAGNIRTLNQSASIDTQNPTLNANLGGTLGSNNWYTAAALNASASDPTPGSGLSAIEYNLDNSNWIMFPATGVLSLPNGKHMIDIRAIDNAGRTVSSSKAFSLDSVAPDIRLDPNGTLGTNDWYITNLSLTASTSDENSGIDVFEYSLDNNAWKSYTAPLTLSDGLHNISFWAQDQAGLVKQVDSTYQVDTLAPQIAGNLSGVAGLNGWYISDVTLSASASDPTPGSGLDAFTYILNNGTSIPYTIPISITDGQHTIQFTAQDRASLNYSIQQNINVDTIHPSLTISSTLPSWLKGNVTLNGNASDNGSGLSKVEISTDGGQNWQAVTGATSWSYDWNTQNISDGSVGLHVRATDKAGLTTEQTINVGLDNHAPQISLPDSWLQWSSVTLDVWDDFSGVSEARVEISDPEGRWPTRVIQLDPNQFPLTFKWDRRFGNDKIAPSGTYDVKVIASDKLGNTAEQDASIKVLLSILPSGPTATPQPYLRAAATPIPTSTTVPNSFPTVTPTVVTSTFGVMEPTAQATSTPASVPTPRTVPTQTSVLDWFESLFTSHADSKDSVTELVASPAQSADSQSADSQSNILWGAAAAAMVGAATSYAQEERRKQQEEKARQAALEAQEEERHKKIQAKQMEKLEAKWKQEAAWEAALHPDFGNRGIDAKLDRMEKQDEAEWIAAQAAARQQYEEKKKAEEAKKKAEAEQLQAGLAAYYAATRPDEKVSANTETNWWEKTKSFVRNEIIQPVNSYVYKPFIEPAVDKTKTFLGNESEWINEHIYQPYIQPVVEKTKQFVISEGTWLSENIYQPYIKPVIEKTKETIARDLSWVNENIYQPYIQPAISTLNEKIYQPYVKPVLDKTKELIATSASWVDKNIYQPYIQPVVSYVDQNFYTPYLKPVVDDVSSWGEDLWDKYGDWVHGALDTVGFIPGLGDIADGLNGLIYLGEGRYIEASVSALAMIPLLGDLGKAGKWGVEIGAEVVEEVAEKVVKEVTEELVEDVVEETVEEVAEKVFAEAGEELVEQTTEEALEEVAEKTLEEAGEELTDKVAKATVGVEKKLEKTKEIISESAEKFIKGDFGEVTQGNVSKLPDDILEVLKATPEDTGLVKEFTQELEELIDPLIAQPVHVDITSGAYYISKTSDEAKMLISDAKELVEVGETSKAIEKVHELAHKFLRGSGDTAIIGRYPDYIQKALKDGGVFFDVGESWGELLQIFGNDKYGSFLANEEFLYILKDYGVTKIELGTELSKTLDDGTKTTINLLDWLDEFNTTPDIPWDEMSYGQMEALALETSPMFSRVENSLIWEIK